MRVKRFNLNLALWFANQWKLTWNLSSPVTARQIRIWPIENGYETEDYKLYKSMRVEIYGCNKDGSEINDGDQEN